MYMKKKMNVTAKIESTETALESNEYFSPKFAISYKLETFCLIEETHSF